MGTLAVELTTAVSGVRSERCFPVKLAPSSWLRRNPLVAQLRLELQAKDFLGLAHSTPLS